MTVYVPRSNRVPQILALMQCPQLYCCAWGKFSLYKRNCRITEAVTWPGVFLLKIFGLLWYNGSDLPGVGNAEISLRQCQPLEHICHSSPWTAEVGEWGVRFHPLLHYNFQASLSYRRSCLKRSFQTKPKPNEIPTVFMCSDFISGVWEVDSTSSCYPRGCREGQLLLTLFYIQKLRGRGGNCLV